MQQPPPPPPPAAPPPRPYPGFGYQPYGQQPQAWVPPAPVSRRRWWIWGCGGCAAIALLAIAVIVFVFIRIFTSSPLRHFPTEASAATTQDHFQAGNNLNTETLLIVDPHSLAQVEAYYQQALRQNGWTTETHDPSQASSGDTWSIGRTDAPSQTGSITFTTVGTNTDIAVTYSY